MQAELDSLALEKLNQWRANFQTTYNDVTKDKKITVSEAENKIAPLINQVTKDENISPFLMPNFKTMVCEVYLQDDKLVLENGVKHIINEALQSLLPSNIDKKDVQIKIDRLEKMYGKAYVEFCVDKRTGEEIISEDAFTAMMETAIRDGVLDTTDIKGYVRFAEMISKDNPTRYWGITDDLMRLSVAAKTGKKTQGITVKLEAGRIIDDLLDRIYAGKAAGFETKYGNYALEGLDNRIELTARINEEFGISKK